MPPHARTRPISQAFPAAPMWVLPAARSMLKDKATLLREAAEEAERISKAASADNRIGELADPLQNLADALAAVLTQELAPSET